MPSGHGQLDIRGAVLIRATTESKMIGPVEVVRSFSYKLSLKNPDGSPTYESADFFACSKAQCLMEDRDEVSEDLNEFCMDEVLDSIFEFRRRRAERQAEKKPVRSAA